MGKLVILSGSSGSGKTTICQGLIERFPQAKFSISVTTRPARDDEKDGVDYLFISKERFRELIDQDALAEWEEVHGNLYGTLKKTIEDSLNGSCELLMDVDPKGALHLKEIYPEAITIFLKTDNIETLVERLRKRNTESDEQIALRMERIREELPLADRFDYIVRNFDVNQTIDEIVSLMEN